LLAECLDVFTGPREIFTEVEEFAERLAAIRYRLAEVLRAMGMGDDAHEQLAVTLDHAQHAARERPDDPRVLGNLAHVYFLSGQAHFNGGRMRVGGLARSLADLGKALEIMERVIELDPREPLHRSGIASICAEIGGIQLALSETEEAAGFFERALAAGRIASELAPEDVRWQADLSTSLTAMGLVRGRQGRLDAAIACQREALGIRERIARRDPDSPVHLEALAISHLQTAKALLDPDEATPHLRETIRLMRILIGFDPGNTSWNRILREASELLPGPDRG
jgi:tetratricopeptide (TPR) repeat protein